MKILVSVVMAVIAFGTLAVAPPPPEQQDQVEDNMSQAHILMKRFKNTMMRKCWFE